MTITIDADVLSYISEQISLDGVSEQLSSDDMCNLCNILDNNASLFMFLSKELRDDTTLALTAVSQCPDMVRFVSKRLQGDVNIFIAALSKDQFSDCVKYATEQLC